MSTEMADVYALIAPFNSMIVRWIYNYDPVRFHVVPDMLSEMQCCRGRGRQSGTCETHPLVHRRNISDAIPTMPSRPRSIRTFPYISAVSRNHK
jgi:hypothetical protein